MVKVKDSRFTRLGVAVSLFTLAVFGVFSLGIVWLRMEISENASTCGLLEDEREKVNRRLRALRGQKSASMRPTRLAALVKGRLSMPGVSSQFYITEGEMKKRLSSDDSSNASPRSRKLAGNFVQ
ncbi:MAG: hypothetical protein HN494_17380 [Opitutae bacterium]|jgi:hypothetical protein|nr:hypothetical protein [Opitutae bacterium]MBT5910575.1 hypothetical protein [Opitutae bacterium]MBT6852330.1 hypothetical protein [Opitutae bacterium]MBT7925341.1 hypothetical protein [Opitutae bacterium]